MLGCVELRVVSSSWRFPPPLGLKSARVRFRLAGLSRISRFLPRGSTDEVGDGILLLPLKGEDVGINTELVPFLPNPVFNVSQFRDTSNAAYGQGTYAITSTLNATAGVRYTSEKTYLTLENHNALVCQVDGVPATGAPCINNFNNSFSNVSYTGGLDWQVLDSVLLYAKTSRGFRARRVQST